MIEPEKASKILGITLGDKVVRSESLIKSFFDLDLTSTEGVTSFLTLLPLMAEDAVMQACSTVWPGFPVEEFDLRRAKFELKGYFLDYLRKSEEELAQSVALGEQAALEEQEAIAEEGAPEEGVPEDTGEEVVDGGPEITE